MDYKTAYNEIRDTCKLIAYGLKFAGKGQLWVETYRDAAYEYYAMFPDRDDWNLLPFTISHVKLNET